MTAGTHSQRTRYIQHPDVPERHAANTDRDGVRNLQSKEFNVSRRPLCPNAQWNAGVADLLRCRKVKWGVCHFGRCPHDDPVSPSLKTCEVRDLYAIMRIMRLDVLCALHILSEAVLCTL